MDSETSRDDYDVVEEIRSSVKTAGHFDTLTDDGARRVVDALGRVLDVLARNDPSIRAALDAAPQAAPREGEPTTLDVGSDRYERTPTGWTRHAHGRRYTVQAPYGAVLDALASQQAALAAAGEAEKRIACEHLARRVQRLQKRADRWHRRYDFALGQLHGHQRKCARLERALAAARASHPAAL